jgi:thymidylate synthase (FAD)
MKVKLLSYTDQAEVLCATAARTCYSSDAPSKILENVDETKAGKFIDNVVGMGHHSIIEHAYYTFSLEGVSRAMTHQLVRHRLASFSQQSQRYVSLLTPDYVVPHTVKGNPEAERRFREAMDQAWDAYRKLAEIIPVELLHFFTLRCCNRAQWEIREVADLMLEEALKVSPAIFKDAGPGCVRGPCPEGKMSCGRPRKKR